MNKYILLFLFGFLSKFSFAQQIGDDYDQTRYLQEYGENLEVVKDKTPYKIQLMDFLYYNSYYVNENGSFRLPTITEAREINISDYETSRLENKMAELSIGSFSVYLMSESEVLESVKNIYPKPGQNIHSKSKF